MHLEVSCIAVICFSSPALSWQRPTPGKWVPFICVRERGQDRSCSSLPQDLLNQCRRLESLHPIPSAHTLCFQVCSQGAEVQSTVAGRADIEGLVKYQGKSPSHHVLNSRTSGYYQGSSAAHPCCWLLTLQLC